MTTTLSTVSHLSFLAVAKSRQKTKAEARRSVAAPRMPKRTRVHFAEDIEFVIDASLFETEEEFQKSDRWYTVR
jgi:hypothetical protein